MLPFLQTMRQEAARCGLWPRIRMTIEAIVIASVLFCVGLGATAASTAEWQIIAAGCFTVAALLGALAVWGAKHTYIAWQDATVEYEQSDEPPTKLFSELNHAA